MLSSTSTSISSSYTSSSETSEWCDEEIVEKRCKKAFEKVLTKSDKNESDDDISDVYKEESDSDAEKNLKEQTEKTFKPASTQTIEECPYDIKCELPNMMIVKVSKPSINKKLPMNVIKKYMVSFVNFVRMTSDVYISDKMFKENLERLKKEFNEMLEIVNK